MIVAVGLALIGGVPIYYAGLGYTALAITYFMVFTSFKKHSLTHSLTHSLIDPESEADHTTTRGGGSQQTPQLFPAAHGSPPAPHDALAHILPRHILTTHTLTPHITSLSVCVCECYDELCNAALIM